ncbi:MAG: hypothetical protein BWK78_02125 [Thiotrichaceae bacterium IS1]|nr:MAG: hypothetical protein BWK78_02125 [Thiotrichaceae bacterium IS1]
MTQANQKFILWVEDRPETVESQIYEAKNKGYQVEVVATPSTIKDVLEQEQVVAIIMDVMLYGVRNLKNIKIDVATTEDGLEAGWVLLERFIRAEDSPYAKIPILVLSARRLDDTQQVRLEELRLRGGGKIDYLEKAKRGWLKEFSDWLDKLDQQLREKNTHA